MFRLLRFDIIFQRVRDDLLQLGNLLFLIVAFLWVKHVFMSASPDFELHIVEVGAFDLDAKSAEDWWAEHCYVVVVAHVEVMAAIEHGGVFIHRDGEWVDVDFVFKHCKLHVEAVDFVVGLLAEEE